VNQSAAPLATHSLSRRIVWQFCLFTLLLSAVYGAISLTLMYILEDSFIEQQLAQEASYLLSSYQQNGEWPAPRQHNMQLHFSSDTFPLEIRTSAIAEPERIEFYGQQGRHYHRYPINQPLRQTSNPDSSAQPQAWLLAEVSNDLLVRPMRDGVLQFWVVSALLVSGIACWLAWLVSRRTTRPLKQLAELVNGVAPERLPQHFAAQYPRHEVGVLARTLEQALQRIAHAIQREKNFTRDVSHELRTPLAVIKNTVELWRSQQGKVYQADLDERTTADAMDRIVEAAQQMEKTVQTLLILAREEHAPTEQSSPLTALMPLLEQAIIDNSLYLQDKAVDVIVCDSCQVQLSANPAMLKVLLDNLLSNAFHYTSEGFVKLAFHHGQLQISDSGPGIEPSVLHALATPDALARQGAKGQYSTGFGFGLSIVKRLCEHQGWQMKVHSAQGTVVTILFLQNALP